MRKIVLLLWLVLAAQSAMAEWTRVTEDKDGSAIFYSGASSIQRSSDGLAKIWELNDLKEQHAEGTKSTKILVEYDCVGEQYRVHSVIAYSQNMGSGKVIANLSPSEINYSPVAPDSVDTQMLKFACGKK